MTRYYNHIIDLGIGVNNFIGDRNFFSFREDKHMAKEELTQVNWRVEDIKKMLRDLHIPATESNIDKAYNTVLKHRRMIQNKIKETNFSA